MQPALSSSDLVFYLQRILVTLSSLDVFCLSPSLDVLFLSSLNMLFLSSLDVVCLSSLDVLFLSSLDVVCLSSLGVLCLFSLDVLFLSSLGVLCLFSLDVLYLYWLRGIGAACSVRLII